MNMVAKLPQYQRQHKYKPFDFTVVREKIFVKTLNVNTTLVLAEVVSWLQTYLAYNQNNSNKLDDINTLALKAAKETNRPHKHNQSRKCNKRMSHYNIKYIMGRA